MFSKWWSDGKNSFFKTSLVKYHRFRFGFSVENSFFVSRFELLTRTMQFDVNPYSNGNARKLAKCFGFCKSTKNPFKTSVGENFRFRNVNLLWFGMGRNRNDEQTHTHSSTHIHISWNLRIVNAVAHSKWKSKEH